jgi:semaphorin 6
MTNGRLWNGLSMMVICRFFVSLVVLRGLSEAITVVQDGWPNGPLAAAVTADHSLVFSGNQTVSDHFRELLIEGQSLIVGARNFVYNISLDTFQEQSRITWYSNEMDVQLCLLRQKTPEECQNFVSVIARRSHNRLLVCGTNAFRPLCHTYSYDVRTGYTVQEIESGVARCPYDPSYNSTAVYVNDQLYSATVADLSSRDSLIYRKPMRTEQHDSQWLNDPNFVSSFVYNDRVYFFFRETAVENINCGKAVFSRVARVCVNDQGGARVLRHTWTSFFKTRLNCSLPGEFPFYFDEIQSTSLRGDGNVFPTLVSNDRVPMVYAVFTTPRNSLRGAAVCAFKLSDIVASFEGPYKEQKSVHSNWLPVRDADVPDPHPAKACVDDSTMLSDQTLNFIKSHPLMDKAVPAFGGQPVLVQTSLEYSLTQIAVDWQVSAADYRFYDVLFIGTDNGRVLKAINKGRDLTQIEPFVIEVLSVFDVGLAVTGLRVHRHPTNPRRSRLIVMSRDEIRSVPLYRCHRQLTCSDCVALRDPYCSWVENRCIHSAAGHQSIETGRHARCPFPEHTKPPKTSSTTAPLTTTTTMKTTTTADLTTSTGASHDPCPQCKCRDVPQPPDLNQSGQTSCILRLLLKVQRNRQ